MSLFALTAGVGEKHLKARKANGVVKQGLETMRIIVSTWTVKLQVNAACPFSLYASRTEYRLLDGHKYPTARAPDLGL